MLLSHCGKYSFVPNVKTVTRAINALDDKQRITWCRVILKSGKSDHCNFIIDKNAPRGLKTTVVDKSAKVNSSLTDTESKKAEKSKWSLYSFKSNYLATNSNAFMTRALFRRYLTLYNNFLKSKKKRKILLMDRLRAHIMDWEKYKEWRKSTSNVVYFDTESFSNLELAYLPANSTGLVQPADLTYNSVVQQTYASWFNDQPDKFSIQRGEKLEKIASILDNVSPKVIKAAWNLSELKSLHTTDKTDDQTSKEILKSHKDWKKILDRKFFFA